MVGIGLNDNVSMLVVGQHLFTSIDKYTLAAIPFFILAGNLMEIGGISQRLVAFAKSIVGGMQGGLACTCVLTCLRSEGHTYELQSLIRLTYAVFRLKQK